MLIGWALPGSRALSASLATPVPKASTPAPKASATPAPKASTLVPRASATPAPKASTPGAQGLGLEGMQAAGVLGATGWPTGMEGAQMLGGAEAFGAPSPYGPAGVGMASMMPGRAPGFGGQVAGLPTPTTTGLPTGAIFPRVDIVDNRDHVIVYFHLPGVAEEGVKVDVQEEDTIVVSGQRYLRVHAGAAPMQRESEDGAFKRVVR